MPDTTTTVPISVIIPYYRASTYFPEALASVRAQTRAPAEIIVVDDGSAAAGDPAAAHCDADIRVIGLPANEGPGPARNAGVTAARQPYIAFLDADDAWLPEKLEAQYELMRSWPELDATHTHAVYLLPDGGEHVRADKPRALSLDAALIDPVMVTPSIVMKRSSFLALGGFDPRFRCTQDWELQIRLAEAGRQVQFLPRILVRVRREDHGHHSANWRCFLAGHLRILWKHRRLYRQRAGTRGWLHRAAFEFYRAGNRQGGLIGSCLKIPMMIGV